MLRQKQQSNDDDDTYVSMTMMWLGIDDEAGDDVTDSKYQQ